MLQTGPSLEFIGTATTVLRLGPFTVLTDPNFLHRGQRAYLGKGLFSKRLTEPSLQPEQLPPLDAVLLSHLHGDHFDRAARRGLDHDLPVHTTHAAARTLRRWGFGNARGMDTWDRVELASGAWRLRVTATPGVHGPGVARHLLPSVMGTVLELSENDGPVHRTYVTGDTLCRPWLAQISRRTGPIDAMVTHLGGTRVLGLLATMDAAQGADLVELLSPGLTVAVHYDDYTVFRSPVEQFVGECGRRGVPGRVRVPTRGQRIQLRLDTP